MSRWYLGLSTSGHDPALALVDASGRLRYAEATERFVQDKRAWGIAPDHVGHLAAALSACGLRPGEDSITVACSWASDKAALDGKVHDALLPAADTLWLRAMQSRLQPAAGEPLARLGFAIDATRRFDHHLCHAAAACSFSPLADAACLVIDGEGEVGAVSLFRLENRRLARIWRSWGPGSLGSYYAWLTRRCGFDWRAGEEWKVMGLAAFGTPDPALRGRLEEMLQIERGRPVFAGPDDLAAIDADVLCRARSPAEPPEAAAGLAATGQAAYAGFADRILAEAAKLGQADLVLTGGCALNSAYNGTIAGRTGFARVFVPPCPADDGNAIGAALLAWQAETGSDSLPPAEPSPFLGATPDAGGMARLRHAARGLTLRELGEDSPTVLASELAQGRVIGVFRERAEFGPRALGHRSILADPRSPGMKDRINAGIKGREAYRPFAPVIEERAVRHWFEGTQPSPYMSFTLPWRSAAKARVPAVVHADGTGRLQTVTAESRPWMTRLLRDFEGLTGVPILLNTSFNVMGKPIVNAVEDAMAVLMTSDLDAVLIGGILVEKPAA